MEAMAAALEAAAAVAPAVAVAPVARLPDRT
jgi:hypothetical protein